MSSLLDKLKLTVPYNLFFTSNVKVSETFDRANSISFSDLFCPSLGRLKATLQLTSILDLDWLLQQYADLGQTHVQLTVFYGKIDEEEKKKYTKEYLQNDFENVITHQVVLEGPILKTPKNIENRKHHCKMAIHVYEDNSLRVIIFTGDLTYDDWNCYTQGVWISPRCPRLSDDQLDENGESPTLFKSQLVQFLNSYNPEEIKDWLEYVKRADFSSIKVCLLTQTVGEHSKNETSPKCLMFAMEKLLKEHGDLSFDDNSSNDDLWDIVLQASSVGFLGKSPNEWFLKDLISTLATTKTSNKYRHVKIIYPSHNDVIKNQYGTEIGEKISFWMSTSNSRKNWITKHLHSWKADLICRSTIMPQIKSYCRMSPCETKLGWYLLTTANISKSAWGRPYQHEHQNSFATRRSEIGILFLPKFFDMGYFKIRSQDDVGESADDYFPLVYDTPLTRYKPGDKAWVSENTKSRKW